MDYGALEAVLTEARTLGFLGPGPVGQHIEHSLSLIECLETSPRRVIDLGSGGGIPGLVLAASFSEANVTLLDAGRRRVDFLERSVRRLGLSNCVALCAQAEEAARDTYFRGVHDLVTARGFGRSPIVVECAAPFLEVGGLLVVSEPPGSTGDRWPAEGLALAGMTLERVTKERPGFVLVRQTVVCPERLPRRPGVPRRRPLFHVEHPE